ncbi:hypothetical protein Ancab_038993 [Ancistrocladus abbreviatus]
MVSDSFISAAIPNASKDYGKKKRANRSAKLKQCKLDARREQWLSQVKNKGGREEENGGGGEFQARANGVGDKVSRGFKDLEIRRLSEEGNDGSIHHDSDFESPTNSPTSGGTNSGNNFTGSSSSSSSSFSSGGSCSGNITEEEEGAGRGGVDDDDDCVDDWEAVADAFEVVINDKQPENPIVDTSTQKDAIVLSETSTLSTNTGKFDNGMEKLKAECGGVGAVSVPLCRAWRPDDALRPQSLPILTKQRSCPMNSEKHCEHRMNPCGHNNGVPVPSSCPICCEDLDLTDSSFLPCSCGFRLCLFCHKRIIEEDGRCPGCRKPYELDPIEKEASVFGGSLTIRLARSCSMVSRV